MVMFNFDAVACQADENDHLVGTRSRLGRSQSSPWLVDSVPVASSADLATSEPEQGKDRANHDDDDAERPDNRDLSDEANDQQDDSENDHVCSPSMPCGLIARDCQRDR